MSENPDATDRAAAAARLAEIEAQVAALMSEATAIRATYGLSQESPIPFLKLSPRTRNLLRREGFTTVEELRHTTDDALCDIRNFGLGSLEEIRNITGPATPPFISREPAVGGTSQAAAMRAQTMSPYMPSAASRIVLERIGCDLEAAGEQRPVCSERDSAILDDVIGKGESLRLVGSRRGISAERVRQVLVAHTGLHHRDVLAAHRGMLESAAREATEARIRKAAAEEPSATLAELAARCCASVQTVRDVLSAEDLAGRGIRGETHVADRTARDEQVFAELRRIAKLPGGGSLTMRFYDAHTKDVTAAAVVARYGTWTAACEAAGVEPRPRAPKRTYKPEYSEELVLRWISRWLHDEREAGTRVYAQTKAFEWLKEHHGAGAPSPGTLMKMLRARRQMWHEIRLAALEVDPVPPPVPVTKAQALTRLQAIASHAAGRLTPDTYNELRATGDLASSAIARLFGGWEAALARAGVGSGSVAPAPRRDRISTARCEAIGRQFAEELGHDPAAMTWTAFLRWHQKQREHEDLPSAATIRKRLLDEPGYSWREYVGLVTATS